MSAMKEYYHEVLTDTEFDLMFDDEYELWLESKKREEEEYYSAIGDGMNENYCNTL